MATKLTGEAIEKHDEAKQLGLRLQKLFKIKYTVIRIGDDFFAMPRQP
jgi:hypothetical protein